MPCQCAELSEALSRAGLPVRVPGVRCGACVEEIVEAKNRLVRENNELLQRLVELERANVTMPATSWTPDEEMD